MNNKSSFKNILVSGAEEASLWKSKEFLNKLCLHQNIRVMIYPQEDIHAMAYSQRDIHIHCISKRTFCKTLVFVKSYMASKMEV